jgi:Zinc finger, C3HC4 type (RING finger)
VGCSIFCSLDGHLPALLWYGICYPLPEPRWKNANVDQALVLNRVNVYASSRQRIFLTWEKRLALRIIPILLFIAQIRQLLQALRCQTSPDFSQYRYGKPGKNIMLDWSTSGGWLHTLSSALLYGTSDRDACLAVGMGRPSPEVRAPYGSFSLLWPTFLRVCLSHLTETVSCSLQQLPLMTETGMSVFEHSLAFAEAETMLYSALGLGLIGSSKSATPSSTVTASQTTSTEPGSTFHASATVLALTDAATSLSGPHVLNRMNVPTEVLLIALLSSCNSLSSNIIAVFNRQRSLRLVNTGTWAFCFISAFVWGFFSVSTLARVDALGREGRLVSSLLHFPTVCILGFMPHLLILIGMSTCVGIYVLALLLTAMSLGSNPEIPRPTSLWQRFVIAHENLQAALQIKGISIKWHEDIYTALLRIGFIALTAASEAVFLNEGRSVEVRRFTWLEEDRLDEARLDRKNRTTRPPTADSHFHITEEYGLPPAPGVDGLPSDWQSGYAKEGKLKDADNRNRNAVFEDDKVTVYPNPRATGVGAVQRSTRFYLLYLFWRGVLFLMGGWLTFFLGLFLDRIGVTMRPRWLRRLVGKSQKKAAIEREKLKAAGGPTTKATLDFWYLTDEGELVTPDRDDLDIEHEMRRRIMMEHPTEDTANVERKVDDKLYQWWKMHGWWGTLDTSDDYRPPLEEDFDDNTSVVSVSTATSTSDEQEWESESDGRRTPTQTRPFPSTLPTRESTPFDSPLDPITLARLLNPTDRASKEEARILASHLSASDPTNPSSSNKILTRSQYRRQVESDRARVLFAGRHPQSTSSSAAQVSSPPSSSFPRRPLTPAEESEILESLILSRRQSSTQHLRGSETAPPTGPLCVVCQSSARTIIAWPCRCLCVCEDCRVSLALNNFGNCVTCRRGVSGFVRLWVP